MPDKYTYSERVESYSPSTAGFGIEGGRAQMTVDVDNEDLRDKCLEILGSTTYDLEKEWLIRMPPKRHPQFDSMVAVRISSIVGIGEPEKTSAASANHPEGDTFDNYALYPKYRLTIEFEQVPFPILSDDRIDIEDITYTPPDVSPHGSNSASTVTIANEWIRWTDILYAPAGEYITAERGQFVFDLGSGGGTPNNFEAGEGQVRQYIPSRTILFRWYRVPEDYLWPVTGGIQAGKGCINQLDWYDWSAGHLLYRDVRVIGRYTPPFPEVNEYYGTNISGFQKLVDLEFVFDELAVDPAVTPSAAATANVIQAGHNLRPWANTSKWYFVKVANTNNALLDGLSVYPSYPFQMIFTNPFTY